MNAAPRRSSRNRRGPARRASHRRQRGTTVVEFAIVFPLFFVVLYGIVAYSMIFVMEQGMSFAAAEGARTALNYQVGPANAPTMDSAVNAALQSRATLACTRAKELLNWFPSMQQLDCETNADSNFACSYSTAMRCIQLTVTYQYANAPLIPPLPLMHVLTPDVLTSQATVQLNPENVL